MANNGVGRGVEDCFISDGRNNTEFVHYVGKDEVGREALRVPETEGQGPGQGSQRGDTSGRGGCWP